MSRLPVLSLFFALLTMGSLLLTVGNAQASGDGGEGKKMGAIIDASRGIHGMVLHPAEVISDPVTGVNLNITQFSYPGVPDRASCRTVVRVANDGNHKIALYTLIRTFDADKNPLGTWMTPSGILAPGQAEERLYSCKLARYMVLDRSSASGWPNICTIDGEERTPCPVQLTLDVNIDFLPGSPSPSAPTSPQTPADATPQPAASKH